MVAEAPEYARALALAWTDAPGPFERVATEAFYYLTPPDAASDARRREDHLSRFNRHALTLLSIHEAYPGHLYQRLSLARSPSRLRAALGSAGFAEGWADYCEQMMLDEGFGGNNPALRLAQLHSALVGLCRYLVGLRLHSGGMGYEQAVEFFVREGHLPRTVAEREARRCAVDPSCVAGTLGKMEILRLREEWRRQMGDSFRLGEFHDRLLSYGAPPLKILRTAMLGEGGAGGASARDANSAAAVPDGAPQSVAVDFSVLAAGQMSDYVGGRRLELVTGEGEWRSAWGLIGGGRPIPEVNFNTRAVLVAYQGQKPSGGYGIEVAGVRRVGTVLAVKVNERRPASGDVTTQVITSPFVAVSVPRPPTGASARFDEGAAAVEKPSETKGVAKPRGRGGRRRTRRPR